MNRHCNMAEFIANSKETFDYLKEKYSEIYIGQGNGYILFRMALPKNLANDNLHYEFYEGKMQVHFEWGTISKYWPLRDFFMRMTNCRNDIEWLDWQGHWHTRAILNKEISSLDSLDAAVIEIRGIFDTLIKMFYHIDEFASSGIDNLNEITPKPSFAIPSSNAMLQIDENEPVSLYEMSLLELLNLDLRIPDYQRIYCWKKKNVIRLLKDVYDSEGEYRLGCIILQRVPNGDSYSFDIIDGQQRLTTLAMFMNSSGVNNIRLLDGSYKSKESNDYVAYNKYLINTFLSGRKIKTENELIDILNRLTFSVLILNDSSIHLAYTFFSNQNSKGKPLSDYDLLKAHHLRFINDDSIQLNKATRWNEMISTDKDDENEKSYIRTLDLYLFRLRKWLVRDQWSEQEPHRIKNEYEASESLIDLAISDGYSSSSPYFEAIRGGEYFFDFTDYYVSKFKDYVKTFPYAIIHSTLIGESHWYYRDIIEALLFAYYLKFGERFLYDAAILISRYVSSTRLNGRKADFDKALINVGEMRIAPRIESAGEPSILFRQLINDISVTRIDIGNSKIQQRYLEKLRGLLAQLSCKSELKSVKPFSAI